MKYKVHNLFVYLHLQRCFSFLSSNNKKSRKSKKKTCYSNTHNDPNNHVSFILLPVWRVAVNSWYEICTANALNNLTKLWEEINKISHLCYLVWC
uniref:Uncharacterized protein MANES_06G174700 n=1 Tax=Rhizophora mucronata TaxID=61149 RepID=A0A2P2LC34_RHIMU